MGESQTDFGRCDGTHASPSEVVLPMPLDEEVGRLRHVPHSNNRTPSERGAEEADQEGKIKAARCGGGGGGFFSFRSTVCDKAHLAAITCRRDHLYELTRESAPFSSVTGV